MMIPTLALQYIGKSKNLAPNVEIKWICLTSHRMLTPSLSPINSLAPLCLVEKISSSNPVKLRLTELY